MSHQHLSVYLNDHLAGSNSALEMLEALQAVNGLTDWAKHISGEIAEDRADLEALMATLQIGKAPVRQAFGWAAGRLAELKTRLDDRKGGGLHRLELLEALALGIEGKKALWTALQSAAETDERLRGRDYARLARRAAEQRQQVELRRLAAAAEALQTS
jgi:hypothetical protein